jgi:hypothetical protein
MKSFNPTGIKELDDKISKAILKTRLTEPARSDSRIVYGAVFYFARLIKTIYGFENYGAYSTEEHDQFYMIVGQWAAESKIEFTEELWILFRSQWSKANTPVGGDGVGTLKHSFNESKKYPYPKVCEKYKKYNGENMMKLIRLCWYLSGQHEGDCWQFPLAQEPVGDLLGLCTKTIGRYLFILMEEGVLSREYKGTFRQGASEYIYLS